MSVSEISRRYAKALLALGKQKGTHRQIVAEVQAVRAILEKDADIASYFQNPMITPQQKLEVIKNGFAGKGLSEDVLNLLLVLTENQRIGSIGGVADALENASDAEEGITRGIVRAARPLTAEAQKELEQKISTTLNKKILLTFQEDPKILGGLIAQVGGWTFDDSLETHLRKLNEELNRSAN
ncbi:MAG: ATP synthase F1 subunit delta [Bdellovibrionaceae bacterium]|nr:ATP synthase F1 subunit delta [Pseudobdellovibrionaceae bacterium]